MIVDPYAYTEIHYLSYTYLLEATTVFHQNIQKYGRDNNPTIFRFSGQASEYFFWISEISDKMKVIWDRHLEDETKATHKPDVYINGEGFGIKSFYNKKNNNFTISVCLKESIEAGSDKQILIKYSLNSYVFDAGIKYFLDGSIMQQQVPFETYEIVGVMDLKELSKSGIKGMPCPYKSSRSSKRMYSVNELMQAGLVRPIQTVFPL